MENIANYVALQKELLGLEREEEKRESIASGDGNKLSTLELNGLAICRLSIESVSSDVGGRQVVRLVTRGGRQLAPARISTGDLVAIREQKQRESTAGAPSSLSVTEGVVKSLDEKSLEIACDEPFGDEFDRGSVLAVTKITSDVTHKRYTNALESLAKAAEDPTHDAYSLIHILLGDSSPRFHSDSSLSARQGKFLASLNEKQKEAVMNALRAKDLAVIHGPPGTGKTHALIAYIMIEVLRGSRVLAVAPSNVAIDNIAERLAGVDTPPEFVRAGHPARMMPNVLKHSLEYQVQMTDEAKLAGDIRDELNNLEKKDMNMCDRSKRKAMRIEKRRLRKELRQREKSAVSRLLSRKDVVLATISGAGARVLEIAESTSPFDVVVVDEAAQALEAACWVPLLRARKAVLAGDPYQLAGTVKSVVAESRGLKKSILDRVFASASLQPTICMLVTQYRMNTVISTWSSQEFYNGEMKPDASVANRRVIDMDSCANVQENKETLAHPFILIDTAGGDCEEAEQAPGGGAELGKEQPVSNESHASRSNKGEAQILVDIVDTFVQCGIAFQDISVISPYSGQVELLRSQLWPRYGRALEVATIDSFQGREKEIVCMSLVRSNEAGKVGFLSDDRRMNVAITRAKRCVVVVCDTETISTHPLLARMVEYVERHGHYRSAVVDFPGIIGTFSQSRRPKEAIEAEEKSRSSQRRQTKAAGRKCTNIGKTKRMPNQDLQGNSVEKIDDDEHYDSQEWLREDIERFLQDNSSLERIFSSDLSALERRWVHELADEYGLIHQSFGEKNERRIKLQKPKVRGEQSSENLLSRVKDMPAGPSEKPPPTSLKYLHTSAPEADRSEVLQDTMPKEVPHEEPDSKPTQESDYKDMNSLLSDLSKAREVRTKAIGQEKIAHNIDPRAEGKETKKKTKRKGDDDEEDFDAVLAKYGAQPNEASPSRFSGPVAQIVNGKLTTSIPPKKNAEARRKLAAKLSKEAEKRRRKPKR